MVCGCPRLQLSSTGESIGTKNIILKVTDRFLEGSSFVCIINKGNTKKKYTRGSMKTHVKKR